MLMWISAGLATVNWIATAIITLTTVAVYQYRINCEKDMTVSSIGKHFKEYEAYVETYALRIDTL